MATTPEKLQLELKDTLEATKFVEVAAMSSRKGDIRILCRVKDRMEAAWLRLVHQCLLQISPKYYYFIGVRYFLVDKELRYGWVLILDAEEGGSIADAVEDMRKLIMRVYLEQTGGHLAPKENNIPAEGILVPSQMSEFLGERAQKAIANSRKRETSRGSRGAR